MNQLPYHKEETEAVLERKSCFNRRAKTPKALAALFSEIAETLVAFATPRRRGVGHKA